MKYSNLVLQLQNLEKKWRGNPLPSPLPKSHPSHSSIRLANNIQYFACSNKTSALAGSLPIVVTVGINYTQGVNKIPDELPRYSKAAHPGLPLVEDDVLSNYERGCIDSFNGSPDIWKQSCLAASNMAAPILSGQDFHLVMTNLSPWITNDSWASGIGAAPAADLLASPPHCLKKSSPPPSPLDHLDDFYKQLGIKVELWIGHGLEAVSPHFRLFVNKHRIAKWLLTANTASGCKPHIQTGSTIKFKR